MASRVMVDIAVIILVYVVIRAIVRFFRLATSGEGLEPSYNRIKNDHLSTFFFLVIGGGAGLIESSRTALASTPINSIEFIFDGAIPIVAIWLGYLFCVVWWLWNFSRSINSNLTGTGTVLDINKWPPFLQTVAVFVLIASAIGAALFIVLAFSYYAANILSLIIPG